jgi:hypothetical protein
LRFIWNLLFAILNFLEKEHFAFLSALENTREEAYLYLDAISKKNIAQLYLRRILPMGREVGTH